MTGRRPDFIVIGAMKAGSTTIYEDLRGCRSVALAEKEAGGLLELRSPGRLALRAYERQFRGVEPGRLVGDVSADYAKLPHSEGLAQTARSVLGAHHQVVYSLRNPVDRLVSHHHHSLARGEITEPDIDVAVLREPDLIGFSRYAWQMSPFLETVGLDRVHLVAFEDYMTDRVTGFGELARFLGLEGETTATDPTVAFNDSGHSIVAPGGLGRLVRGRGYRRVVRPLIPQRLRSRLRDSVLPSMPPRPRPPSTDTVDRVFDSLEADLLKLVQLGFRPPASWSRDATRSKYERLRAVEGPTTP